MIGEAIISRLPPTTNLHKTDNPVRKIIINSVGQWLDEYDVQNWLNQFFLNEASGKYLDLHGKEYNVLRRINESDEDYRKRIVYETLGQLTIDYLKTVFNAEIYTYTTGYDETDTLLSDNEYINGKGFFIKVDEDIQRVLDRKIVLGSEITWL